MFDHNSRTPRLVVLPQIVTQQKVLSVSRNTLLKLNKEIEYLVQTLIYESHYLCNPMSYTFDISNYEFC